MKSFLLLFLLSVATDCSRKSTTQAVSNSVETRSYHSEKMLDGRVWMTENLGINLPGSYCQKDDTINCSIYGRLYTWEDAKKGCEELGDGWRLPTNEEWQNLAKAYGGIYGQSDDNGKLAYSNLIDGGNSAFNAVLGGNRETDASYERLGAHGFYWTATEHDTDEAWFYNFAKGSSILNRHSGDKKRAISVRCIKEIQN